MKNQINMSLTIQMWGCMKNYFKRHYD